MIGPSYGLKPGSRPGLLRRLVPLHKLSTDALRLARWVIAGIFALVFVVGMLVPAFYAASAIVAGVIILIGLNIVGELQDRARDAELDRR